MCYVQRLDTIKHSFTREGVRIWLCKIIEGRGDHANQVLGQGMRWEPSWDSRSSKREWLGMQEWNVEGEADEPMPRPWQKPA